MKNHSTLLHTLQTSKVCQVACEHFALAVIFIVNQYQLHYRMLWILITKSWTCCTKEHAQGKRIFFLRGCWRVAVFILWGSSEREGVFGGEGGLPIAQWLSRNSWPALSHGRKCFDAASLCERTNPSITRTKLKHHKQISPFNLACKQHYSSSTCK